MFVKVQLLVPTEVIERIRKRFVLVHRNGYWGYFCDITEDELYGLIRSLVASGYRVDITPGDLIRLVSRKQ